jgi:16S rRNA (cytosine967-C5)-methyltransferase
VTAFGARGAALEALCDIRRRGVFAADALNKACEGLDSRDASMAWRIVMGVTQNRVLLDAAIDEKLAGKAEPIVRDILRIGAVQLFYMRVPQSAAVNEAVKQTKAACPRAAGLVNAVLRALAAETPDSVIARMGALDRKKELELRFSLPEWYTVALIERLGIDGAFAFAEKTGGVKPVTLIENALEPPDDAQRSAAGEPHPLLPDARLYDGAAASAPGFEQGKWIVADAGARAAVSALGLLPGQSLWDACSAPGGKALMAAMDMRGKGVVLATDVAGKKLQKIRESAARLRIGILDIRLADASSYAPERLFDAVLCDVPCSGLGVIWGKPDIRFKDSAAFGRFPAVQLKILENAAKAVKPGGVLVYSTCTFINAENEGVTSAFLEASPGFRSEGFEVPFSPGGAPSGEITLWPHIHGTDCFYIHKMRKAL